MVANEASQVTVERGALGHEVPKLLDDIQATLLSQAEAFVAANTRTADDYEGFKDLIAEGGFVSAYWAGSTEDEERVQDETGATIRCIPFDQPSAPGTCVYTGREADKTVLFGRAY